MAGKKLGRGLDYLIKQSVEAPSAAATPPQPAFAESDPAAPTKAPEPAAASPAPAASPPASATGLREIPIAAIIPNANQPRRKVDEAAIDELADSIARAGLMQPPMVRRLADQRYELIAGERRFRACKHLGWKTLPVIVKEVDDDRRLELALIENIQREDLNPIECAEAIREMMDSLELTQEEAARKVGKKRSTVANLLRLLELPRDLQDFVSRGTLTMGHARALLSVPGDNARRALAKEIVDGGLSVRAVEKRAAATRVIVPGKAKEPYVTDLEQKLAEAIGMPVDITENQGKGKVVIRFQDNKEFDRIFARLMKPIV